MKDFLEDYGFIEFTDEHYKLLHTMLEDIDEDAHDNRPCGFGECRECPYSQYNNIDDASCGQPDGNAMVSFANSTIKKIREIIQRTIDDYNNASSFWKLK